MKIFILGSYGPSMVNFRGDMIKSMINKGHEVLACVPDDSENTEIEILKLGAKYIPIKLSRTGMNPVKDIASIYNLIKILKREKPDLLLSYTIKPNIYGSLAAYLSGIKNIYGMMTGAGSILRNKSFKMKVIRAFLVPLYRYCFNKCELIFFLNEDDLNFFKHKGIVKSEKTIIIGSSGVNLEQFVRKPFKNKDTFLFVARLIEDKGIFEFLNAAKIAKKKRPNMKFEILGPFDTNPTAITPDQLKMWTNEGVVEYLGATNDVRPYLENSFAVVLPSHHEGQGRVLIEAMATGRAVVATDVPGCRQTVVDGQTGFLVPLKDVGELAEKMIEMYDKPIMTIEMAANGYERANDRFDVHKINNVILEKMALRDK